MAQLDRTLLAQRTDSLDLPSPSYETLSKVKQEIEKDFLPGANPTTSSYTASVVKIYNATSSRLRLEIKKFFFFEKRSNLLQRWRCSCKFSSRRIGF
jgi:hypothetical protein